MFLWLLHITVLSVLGIFLVHHSFLFLQSVFTTPKIKDLVEAPERKYKRIYETIQGMNGSGGGNSSSGSGSALFHSIDIDTLNSAAAAPEPSAAAATTMHELLGGMGMEFPNDVGLANTASNNNVFSDSSAMKHELKSFLRQMMH